MSNAVITVEQLSKVYRLGLARHDTFRDRIMHGVRSLTKRGDTTRTTANEFWALKDVSCAINQGDVVGIIGRNGAGKSTLLKILSRITEPTTGRVSIRGRVASLLEVGTGFHPELTGRENIFLNGAILGMSRAEIRRKFDEIVAFAEVDRFLDTPVKHYSSGMYVRLAFAVAAHLEPEILIVDEVLAVGDFAFQKKCLGKMQAVAQSEGRTVLYVSHNLQSVRQLCGKALLLVQGRVAATGTANQVVDDYTRHLSDKLPTHQTVKPELAEQAFVVGAAVETLEGKASPEVAVGAPWRVRVTFRVAQSYAEFVVAVGLVSADGSGVQTAWHPPEAVTPGEYEAVFEQRHVMLESGHYSVVVGLSQNHHSIHQIEAATFDITNDAVNGYYPATGGVGAVLNSMPTRMRRIG